MTKKKDENERDEQDEHNEDHRYEQDKKLEGEFFHGLTEPEDEAIGNSENRTEYESNSR